MIEFLSPRRIVFGRGALARAGAEAARLGGKALVVTGRGATRRPAVLNALLASLDAAGVGRVLFDRVEPDPGLATVDAGAAIYKESGCDLVVGLGGGSPLDAAKAVAVKAIYGGELSDFLGRPVELAVPGVLAVPTTAGTGSEVTRYMVVTDAARRLKMLIGGPSLVPAAAVLDPETTLSLPPEVSAATGMDALTHAVEAYLSSRASALTDGYALSAVGLIVANLPRVCAAPQDIAAREAMMLGQMWAGHAFSNASVGLVHSMARPLGARFGVPHGTANAMLLAPVQAWNLQAAAPRLAGLASAMGLPAAGMGGEAAARGAVEALAGLSARLPLPRRLGEFGVGAADVAELAADALASPSTAFNPRAPTVADIEELYRALL